KRKNIKDVTEESYQRKKPKKNEEFTCYFLNLYQNSNVVGSGSLIDNLYMLDVVSSHNEILQTGSRGTRRKLIAN
ncbi:hypothetical protein CR513_02716, partial [Mucuna pruriens]